MKVNDIQRMKKAYSEVLKQAKTKPTSLTNRSKPISNTRVVQQSSWMEREMQKQQQYEKLKNHRRVRNSTEVSLKINKMLQTFSPQKKQKNPSKLKKLMKTQPDESSLLMINKYKNKSYQRLTKEMLNIQEMNESKRIITEVQKMRKVKKLPPNPKQWQFHNCLNLQKIQLYTTNLRISCDGWVAIDWLQMKYLRGWNQKEQFDFSSVVKILIAKIVQDLDDSGKINLDNLLIRINVKLLETQRVKTLPNNSIMSIRKLITGLLMTNYEDFLVYCVYYVGHLLDIIEKEEEIPQQLFISQFKLEDIAEYCLKIEKKCKLICEQLEIQNTFPYMGKNSFVLKSTPLDISILYLKCINLPLIQKILSIPVYEPQIRYQVGWNFWETRSLKWVNQEYSLYKLKSVGCRNKKHQNYVVFDPEMKIIIAVADCRIGMHSCDIERIRNWVKKSINRFSQKYCLRASFYPTNTQRIFNIK